MKNTDRLLAERLLQISAVKLQPDNPFVWASGWNSPIYTDNRRILSYPDVRNMVKIELSRTILEQYPGVQAIAAVATGAIAIGAIAADAIGLPFVYVRDTPKDHGLENVIEGNVKPGQKVVLVEDLISTAGSALKAVEALRGAGAEVLGVATLFNYEFAVAAKRLRDHDVALASLTTYTTLLDTALGMDYIGQEDVDALREWRKDPSGWTPPQRPF